ncbi:MAG: hypothetical protein DCF19_15310 [Pseudanabaena frigida]|uniref:Uncharacterized protein n=1 Tax=Pseudanabaena frigida TaxID=945775 RepID=A0A2W4W3E3_9CYAN|nr:MAG: hypothetical protein DCF19_15310 [Pseudanabaena frigida]
MSYYWSIIEKSPNRIRTQENISQNISLFFRCLHFLLICIPGLISIWLGLPLLPVKVSCQPSKNIVECRKTQSFLTITVKTETVQQQRKLSRIVEESIPGETTLVWIGVGYIGGIILLILLFSSTVTIRRIWTFDKNSMIVKGQKITSLRSVETIYPCEEINGIILELTDILIDSNPTHIRIKLNFRSDRQPIEYIPFNKKQPVIFSGEYQHFEEFVSSIAQPICGMLNQPLMLNIFSEYGSMFFDFSEKKFEGYAQDKSFNHSFQSIQRFEIDLLSNGRYVIPTDDTAINSYIHYEYIYKVQLVLKDGQRLSVIKIESREALGKRPKQASFPTNDNRAYHWTEYFTMRLNGLINQ